MGIRFNSKPVAAATLALASGITAATLTGCAPQDLSRIPGPAKNSLSTWVPPSTVDPLDVVKAQQTLADNCSFLGQREGWGNYPAAQGLYDCTETAKEILDVQLKYMTPKEGLQEVNRRDQKVAEAIVGSFPSERQSSWCSDADKLVDKYDAQDATLLAEAAGVGYADQEKTARSSISDRDRGGYTVSCNFG